MLPRIVSMHHDLRHLRSIASVLVRRVTAEQRLPFARAFAARSIEAYREALRSTGCSLDFPTDGVRLDGIAEAEAIRLGRSYTHSDGPTAAYLLSTLYTLLLPDDLRAKQGVFFTPPSLVNRLLDLSEEAGVDWSTVSVLDPAAGGGAFITPVASRMARTLLARGSTSEEVVAHLASHLSGIELDPFSAWMAQLFLEMALRNVHTDAAPRIPRIIQQGDSLRREFGDRQYDLVVGNPPFGKVTLEPALRTHFARSLFGHANLYGVFTDLAIRLCRPGGIIGYVTPASFLGGQYFKNLRALLAAEAPPIAIDFIADRAGVFDQVLQETILITLGKGRGGGAVSVHTTHTVDRALACESVASGRFPLPEDAHSPWLLPRDSEDVEFLRGLQAMPNRLRHYGMSVSTGPLVWNRHKNQLAARLGAGRYPLIWAESILSSGDFRFSASKREHQPYFTLDVGQEHLLTLEPAVLVQRTTAKEQSRRLIAALLPRKFIEEHGGVIVENHLNLVYAARGQASVSLHAIAALLNSGVVDRIFRCSNGSVAVSAFEIESLPLPPRDAMDALERLIERSASRATIEKFLTEVYRSSAAEVAA